MRSRQYDILLVDDDEDDRMVMKEIFSRLQYAEHITMYESGMSFLQQLSTYRTFSPLPLLVVLDYNLPGVTGAEVLDQLKKDPVLLQIPVVMYSTGMSPRLRQQCLEEGAMQCFEKSGTYEEVTVFVEQLCHFVGNRHSTC